MPTDTPKDVIRLVVFRQPAQGDLSFKWETSSWYLLSANTERMLEAIGLHAVNVAGEWDDYFVQGAESIQSATPLEEIFEHKSIFENDDNEVIDPEKVEELAEKTEAELGSVFSQFPTRD